MNDSSKKSGARASTRERLVSVFNRLLLEGESVRPTVSELIATAGFSRSTFYDHFDGIEALHDESLSHLFGALAEALTSGQDLDRLVSLLDHVWENRILARQSLSGPRGERAEALLARMIEQRLGEHPDRRLNAILIAGMVMAALGSWVSGKLGVTPLHLAKRLNRSARALIAAPA